MDDDTQHEARYPEGSPQIAPGSVLACNCPIGEDHRVWVLDVPRCDACKGPMKAVTFKEAAPDFWMGPVPDDDAIVYLCAGCGEVEPR